MIDFSQRLRDRYLLGPTQKLERNISLLLHLPRVIDIVPTVRADFFYYQQRSDLSIFHVKIPTGKQPWFLGEQQLGYGTPLIQIVTRFRVPKAGTAAETGIPLVNYPVGF